METLTKQTPLVRKGSKEGVAGCEGSGAARVVGWDQVKKEENTGVLIRFLSIAEINTLTKSNLGGEGFAWLILSHCSQS